MMLDLGYVGRSLDYLRAAAAASSSTDYSVSTDTPRLYSLTIIDTHLHTPDIELRDP